MKKNVLITGANGNLGHIVVAGFIAAHYNVLAIVSPGKASSVPKENVTAFECDLTNESETEATVASIIERYENLDVVLLLAGGFMSGSIQNTDGAALRKMYSLNFETAYFVARPVFQKMIAQSGGGRIVLIGSRPSLLPSDGKTAVAYSLSKSLLFRLAEILNAEGNTANVVTSVVVPSAIDTPTNRMAMPKADFTKWVTPEEITGLLLFIADSKSLRDPVYKIFGKS